MKNLIVIATMLIFLFAPFGVAKAQTQADLVKALQEQITILTKTIIQLQLQLVELLSQQIAQLNQQEIEKPKQVIDDYLKSQETTVIEKSAEEIEKENAIKKCQVQGGRYYNYKNFCQLGDMSCPDRNGKRNKVRKIWNEILGKWECPSFCSGCAQG